MVEQAHPQGSPLMAHALRQAEGGVATAAALPGKSKGDKPRF